MGFQTCITLQNQERLVLRDSVTSSCVHCDRGQDIITGGNIFPIVNFELTSCVETSK